jgi:Ca2+-binding RTX toxin-like protein
MYDGITVLGGKNISITGNILASLPDMNSRVWIGNADGVLSQNNTAANFIYGSNTNVSFDPTNTNTNITVTNDVTLAYVSDGGAATLSQWLLTHPALSPLISSVSDPVAPTAPSEPDSVFSDVSYTLGPSSHNLTLTGTAAIDGTGNTLDNVITGNVAANQLDGGSGLDTLIGGGGNDTYVVGNAGDVITENVGEGTDTVLSSVSFILPANVENLTLTGTSAINGTGNALNNVITGNAAANLLDGGLGADNLAGGAGNDTYVVDNTGDTVTEGLSLGTDTVRSSVSFILPANVENLTLTGSSAINGTGNALNNVIAGNAAANQIMGGGGDDTLTGGAGRDTFIFGPGSGHDTVTDFQNSKTGDTVDISAFTNAGYSAHVSDSTQGLVVNFDTGDSIVLIGIHTSVAGLPALSSDLTSTIKGHAFGHA